jgi:hypothetical protein
MWLRRAALHRASSRARGETAAAGLPDLEGDVLALERVSQKTAAARVSPGGLRCRSERTREQTHGFTAGQAVRVAIDVAHPDPWSRAGEETRKAENGGDDRGRHAIGPAAGALRVSEVISPRFACPGPDRTRPWRREGLGGKALIKSPILHPSRRGRNRGVTSGGTHQPRGDAGVLSVATRRPVHGGPSVAHLRR